MRKLELFGMQSVIDVLISGQSDCLRVCMCAMTNGISRTKPGADPVQGLFVGCIYEGSGDPARVLRLSHNKYAGYTLKHLLLRHMYNLSLPKLRATLLAAGVQLFSGHFVNRPCTVLYCTGLKSEPV